MHQCRADTRNRHRYECCSRLLPSTPPIWASPNSNESDTCVRVFLIMISSSSIIAPAVFITLRATIHHRYSEGLTLFLVLARVFPL